MKKKIVSLCLVVALIAIAVVGASLAFFTDTETKNNTFTVGNVDIKLEEPGWDSEGEAEAEDAYPGEALKKDPIVTNIGDNPCFVRVKVENLDQFGEKGDIALRYKYAAGYNTTDWDLHDGYYYFKGVLAKDGVTNPVFDQIVMPTGLEGDEVTEDIVVTAEAVQAQGARPSFSAVENMTTAEIAAWFDTCGMN